MYKDCDDIRQRRGKNYNPNGNGLYTIDPDGPNGVEKFTVKCDFNTDPEIGITVVSSISFFLKGTYGF